MADTSWEHAAEARAALNAIVTDPEHGVGALSSPRTMSNLLKDLLPDAPREKNLLVAAAEAGLADSLREHVGQGMDADTAIRLTASSFSERSPLSPDACTWVTSEIAKAMGISEGPGPGPAAWSDPAGGGAGAWAGSTGSVPGGQDSSPGGWGASAASGQGGWDAPAPAPAPGAGAWGAGSPGGSNPGGAGYAPAPSGQSFGSLPGQAYPPAAMPGYQPVPGQSRSSNTLAVVAFVLGLLQFIGWIIFVLPGLIAAILAIVLGFTSMRQMRRTGEGGRGLAITGIVLGFAGIVVGLLITVGVIAAIHSN